MQSCVIVRSCDYHHIDDASSSDSHYVLLYLFGRGRKGKKKKGTMKLFEPRTVLEEHGASPFIPDWKRMNLCWPRLTDGHV